MGENSNESDVRTWTITDVTGWLSRNGFESDLCQKFKEQKVDGVVLLDLTEDDLREEPLKLGLIGDIKRLSRLLEDLRQSGGVSAVHSSHHHRVRSSRAPLHTLQIPESPGKERYSPRRKETSRPATYVRFILSLLFVTAVFYGVALSITIAHSRTPDPNFYPPLPDIIIDTVTRIGWGFVAAEYILSMLGVLFLLVLVFHKHRIIVATRFFVITGTVFALRSITMVVTSLSVPGVHLKEPCTLHREMNMSDKLNFALKIVLSGGLRSQGLTTCGDLMFSGHTAMITILTYFIIHYTPNPSARHTVMRSLWLSVHSCIWVLLFFGMFLIVAAHEHYTADVVMAYYISSRCFMHYHVRADGDIRKLSSPRPEYIGDITLSSAAKYTESLGNGYKEELDNFIEKGQRRFRKIQLNPFAHISLPALFEAKRHELVTNLYDWPFRFAKWTGRKSCEDDAISTSNESDVSGDGNNSDRKKSE